MNEKAFYKLTYGLFLLTTANNNKDYGCIINTAVQVASNPARISISILKGNYTHDMILESGVFNISSISKDADFELFKHFGMQSGREVDKFKDYNDVSRSSNNLLYLTKTSNMYMSAKVIDTLDLGSHTLFIAEIIDGEVLSESPSCTYAYYQSDIKPKPQATTSKKTTWTCQICGYVYEGEEMPEDYECPLCHHGKEDFVKNE